MNAKNRKPAQPTQSGHLADPVTPPGKPRKPHETDATPAATPGHLVRLHDLSGLVVISLPETLRDIIGEEAFKLRLDELNRHEFLVIVREPGDVVYINMPIYAMRGMAGMEPQAAANPLDNDKKSKDKASAKRQVKSQTRSKPAVKPSTQAKAKSGRGEGGNQ
jgi:hypothetical protein